MPKKSMLALAGELTHSSIAATSTLRASVTHAAVRIGRRWRGRMSVTMRPTQLG
ncbi:MAG: hypothetical protein JWR53_758 [Glaciihabitans sp.]|nr:hypothetical protein [Glaciihabitans sp.]